MSIIITNVPITNLCVNNIFYDFVIVLQEYNSFIAESAIVVEQRPDQGGWCWLMSCWG